MLRHERRLQSVVETDTVRLDRIEADLAEIKSDLSRIQSSLTEMQLTLQTTTATLKADIRLLKWMLGFVLAFLVAGAWKLFTL